MVATRAIRSFASSKADAENVKPANAPANQKENVKPVNATAPKTISLADKLSGMDLGQCTVADAAPRASSATLMLDGSLVCSEATSSTAASTPTSSALVVTPNSDVVEIRIAACPSTIQELPSSSQPQPAAALATPAPSCSVQTMSLQSTFAAAPAQAPALRGPQPWATASGSEGGANPYRDFLRNRGQAVMAANSRWNGQSARYSGSYGQGSWGMPAKDNFEMSAVQALGLAQWGSADSNMMAANASWHQASVQSAMLQDMNSHCYMFPEPMTQPPPQMALQDSPIQNLPAPPALPVADPMQSLYSMLLPGGVGNAGTLTSTQAAEIAETLRVAAQDCTYED